jgi:hypothetical protein
LLISIHNSFSMNNNTVKDFRHQQCVRLSSWLHLSSLFCCWCQIWKMRWALGWLRICKLPNGRTWQTPPSIETQNDSIHWQVEQQWKTIDNHLQSFHQPQKEIERDSIRVWLDEPKKPKVKRWFLLFPCECLSFLCLKSIRYYRRHRRPASYGAELFVISTKRRSFIRDQLFARSNVKSKCLCPPSCLSAII